MYNSQKLFKISIYFKRLTKQAINQKPFLISCPFSALYKWVNELEIWGYISVGYFNK